MKPLGPLLALLLSGCATREFYLQASEAPWEKQHINDSSR